MNHSCALQMPLSPVAAQMFPSRSSQSSAIRNPPADTIYLNVASVVARELREDAKVLERRSVAGDHLATRHLLEQTAHDLSTPRFREGLSEANVIRSRHRSDDVADVALRFCLDHPYVSSTLVGMPTQAHVKANLNLLGVKTDSKLLQETRSLVGPLFNYVWRSGRPENQG